MSATYSMLRALILLLKSAAKAALPTLGAPKVTAVRKGLWVEAEVSPTAAGVAAAGL
jgi:hypothetical protein